MISTSLLHGLTGAGQPEMALLLAVGARGGQSWSPPGGGKAGQEFLYRTLMRPTVPTWVSLERGVIPSPGNRATRLSSGCGSTGREWVKPTQHSLVVSVSLPTD